MHSSGTSRISRRHVLRASVSLSLLSGDLRAQDRPQPAPPMEPETIRSGLHSHDRALFVKSGWIRDPYVVLGPGDFYYLTGTTPLPDEAREQREPYNTGLGNRSIVGWKMQIWRSKDLVRWESLGAPYSLKDGIWFQVQPERFSAVPESEWRLWAPELHFVHGRWAIVHTSPAPVRGACRHGRPAGGAVRSFPGSCV